MSSLSLPPPPTRISRATEKPRRRKCSKPCGYFQFVLTWKECFRSNVALIDFFRQEKIGWVPKDEFLRGDKSDFSHDDAFDVAMWMTKRAFDWKTIAARLTNELAQTSACDGWKQHWVHFMASKSWWSAEGEIYGSVRTGRISEDIPRLMVEMFCAKVWMHENTSGSNWHRHRNECGWAFEV